VRYFVHWRSAASATPVPFHVQLGTERKKSKILTTLNPGRTGLGLSRSAFLRDSTTRCMLTKIMSNATFVRWVLFDD